MQDLVRADAARGREKLARRANIDAALFVEREVGAREGAILAGALTPDRNVRGDAGGDQPVEDSIEPTSIQIPLRLELGDATR